MVIENWRIEYNTFRPHSYLGYQPPAPEAILPKGTVVLNSRALGFQNKQALTQEAVH